MVQLANSSIVMAVLDVWSHLEAGQGRAEGYRGCWRQGRHLPVSHRSLGTTTHHLDQSTDIRSSRVAETLPSEILGKMHAPPKSDYPVAEPDKLLGYDAVLFGIPTRYGNFPAQWKAFWDKTGGIWASGGFWGKYAGLFVSTGTQGGGQESTALASMSTLSHHGFVYVPLGYKTVFPLLSNLDEVHGGSAWGAGTFAVRLSVHLEHMFLLTDHPL